MTKTLSLKDFEHHISASTWLAADDLVQAGAVKSLREVEAHFWVGKVEDGEASYETEVIITPNKIKAFTCECFTEGRRLMCPHVAASLVKVRQFLDQRTQERQARRDAAAAAALAEPSRLTVRDALENVLPEDLEEFVRDYARRDRDFALALKTYFAGTVTEAENPYALVLESAFPAFAKASADKPASAKASADKPLREPDFRRLRKTLDDLEMQMSDAAAQHHHRSTYQIASAILLKTNPLLLRLDDVRRAAVLDNVRSAFQKMTEMGGALPDAVSPQTPRNSPEKSGQTVPGAHLPTADAASRNGVPGNLPSPELRDAAWDLVFGLGEKDLLPPELLREAVQFLGQSASDEVRFRRISELFDRTPHPAPAFVLHLFLAALAVRQMPQAAVRVLEDYAAQPQTVRDAILQLYYLQHWAAVRAAGEHFLQPTSNSALQTSNTLLPQHRREIEDVLLFIAEKTGDRERQTVLLRQRFRQAGSLDVFQRLKDLLQADWPAELRQLVAELREAGERAKLAAILAAEGDAENLAALLSESEDFALFQRHEGMLTAWDKTIVRDRYTAHLTDFLTEHFGPPASAQVRLQLHSLLRRGEAELVLDVVRALVAAFPDRTTLAAELMEMFPKNQQKRVFEVPA